jgi:hypothetical protein
MSVGGTLNCSSFADICLLLKSSDFVSHDLSYAYARHCRCARTGADPRATADESDRALAPPPAIHRFSESVDEKGRPSQLKRPPQFTLVLRKWFALSPALEFRCFVKHRTLVGTDLCIRTCAALLLSAFAESSLVSPSLTMTSVPLFNLDDAGISQRDPAKFYPFLPRMKAELLELIEDFFDAHILNSFPDENGTRTDVRWWPPY